MNITKKPEEKWWLKRLDLCWMRYLQMTQTGEAKPQDIDSDTAHHWPKIWSPISLTKLKFTRLKYPKDYKTDCDERRCDIPADSRYQEPVDLKASLHNFRVYVNEH